MVGLISGDTRGLDCSSYMYMYIYRYIYLFSYSVFITFG